MKPTVQNSAATSHPTRCSSMGLKRRSGSFVIHSAELGRSYKPWRIFLTREGYERLRLLDLAVARGERFGKASPMERLEVRWSPEEVQP